MNPSYQHYATHDESEYPELWDGCIGAWAPCLGPTGTRLHDNSGRANWGTLNNMDAATDWVVDGGRYALDFDGSNDYVRSSLSGFSTAGDIAISVTMLQRTRSLSSNSAVVEILSPVRSFVYQQAQVGGAFFLFTDGVDAGNNIGLQTDEVPALNAVNHLVFQLRGVSYQWIVNGILRKSGNISSRVGGAVSAVNIGRRESGVIGYTDMILYDAAVYSRTLSLDDIRTLSLRPGIAYTPRRRRKAYYLGPTFNAAWARGANQFIQPSMIGVA